MRNAGTVQPARSIDYFISGATCGILARFTGLLPALGKELKMITV